MIIYYSSTGNTEFIAKELAARLGDETLNLLEYVKADNPPELHSEKPFIICTPVFVCSIPLFLLRFLKRMKLTGNETLYVVFTSGGYAGIGNSAGRHVARKLGMKYMGRAEFTMPRNYVVSGHYPPNTEEEIKKRLIASYRKLDDVTKTIQTHGKLRERYVWLFEKLIILPFVPLWTKYKYKTTSFYVTDKCVGCGKCEKLCPLNVVEMRDGKPTWSRETCTHCMACIQNCPCRAIEYKDRTESKPRYTFARYKKVIEELKEKK